MTQLTTNPKTHVIITFTKSHHFITQKQNDWLIRQGKDVKFSIDGNNLTTNNIAEILTIQKYYETYPDKKPSSYGQPYSKESPVTFEGVMTTAKRARKLERLLAGMRRTASKGNPLLRKVEQWALAANQGKQTPDKVTRKDTYNPQFTYEKVEEAGKLPEFVLKPLI